MTKADDDKRSSKPGENDRTESSPADADVENARRRALVEHAREVLFSTELDGTILDANTSAGVALGIDLSLGRQEALLLCVGRDDAACVRRVLETIAQTSSAELELHLRSPGGRVLWAVRAHFGVEARAVLWSAATVAAHEAPGLRRLVLDKTELLERERLRATMAEAASDAKDRLLAIVGGDSTATLNSVLGWTRLLRREVLDAASRDMALAVIEGNVERHLRLLSELLEVARIVDGELALDLRRVVLGPVIDAAVATTNAAATENGVVLVHSASEARGEDTTILGDRRELERLVRAAVEGFVDGSVSGDHVVIDSRHDDAWFTLRVKGPAAPPSRPPGVARPLQPGATSLQPTAELAFLLVDRIARIHGGTATQSREPNGERVIEARLPRFEHPPIRSSVRGQRPLHGTRVLLFAPNSDMRELAAIHLRDSGANVLSARDASTAAAAVAAFRPDVVVADIAGVDDAGERLLDHFPADMAAASPPVVALATSEADVSNDKNVIRARERVTVQQLVDANTLVDAVRRSRARADGADDGSS